VTSDVLASVQGAMPQDSGVWFWLRDVDTKFSTAPDRARHPFVLPDGFDPAGRRALAHGLPRSGSPPRSGTAGTDFLVHAAHGVCNGRRCDLDKQGWIKPMRYQVTGAWLAAGSYICVEPSRMVLGRIQTFEMEAAGDV